MRENNHYNRGKAHTSVSISKAKTEPPTYTAAQRKTMREGLRILARIIARAHLQREAHSNGPRPNP